MSESIHEKQDSLSSEVLDEQQATAQIYPTLQSWKTSAGFAVLGVIAQFFFGLLLELIFGAIFASRGILPSATALTEEPARSLVGYPTTIVLGILGIIYALVFYRSYFTENPRVKSSKAISFLNLFFGSIIFGCLWNSSLTKGKRSDSPKPGASHVVWIILSVIAIVLAGFNLWTISHSAAYLAKNADGSYTLLEKQDDGSYAAASAPSTASNEASDAKPESSADSVRLSDSATGVSITVPAGWQSVEKPSDYPEECRWMLVPTDKSVKAQIVVMAFDWYGSLSESEQNQVSREDINTATMLDEEHVLSWAEDTLGQVNNNTAELVRFGDYEYWKSRVDGVTSPEQTYSGEEQSMTSVGYYRYSDGYAYIYTLNIANEDDPTVDSLVKDVETLAASAVYER